LNLSAAKELQQSSDSFIFHSRKFSNNFEEQLRDFNARLHLQDQSLQMSFLMISEQIELSKNFYVRFFFMSKEITSNYYWVLNQLKTVYAQMKMPKLTIIVTDMKKRLIVAMRIELSEVHHLFCTWHINSNILVNCKKSFDIKENWNKFFKNLKTIMYASSKTKFWNNWKKFSLTIKSTTRNVLSIRSIFIFLIKSIERIAILIRFFISKRR
jgi:hypothetical protein